MGVSNVLAHCTYNTRLSLLFRIKIAVIVPSVVPAHQKPCLYLRYCLGVCCFSADALTAHGR